MSAKKFLMVLEKSGLLDEATLAELRKQVAESRQKITAESIAKALVERGHLTKFQATKLIGELSADDDAAEDAVVEDNEAPARNQANDDLELAPLDDDAETAPPRDAGKAKGKEFGANKGGGTGAGTGTRKTPRPEEETVMLEDAGGLTPVLDAGAGLTPVGAPAAGLVPVGPAPGLTLEPAPSDMFGGSHAGGLDPFALDAQAGVAPIYVPKKKSQAWDTKLMLGGGFALLTLLVVGAALVLNFWAVPAAELFDAAEKTYNEQAYSDAKSRYEKYLESYPDDSHSSKARVRLQLIQIRQSVADPNLALTTAKEVLPKIVQEAEAEVGREEFPKLLLEIPKGFVQRAKQAADTKLREELLAKAKEGLAIVNDPEYITTMRRTPILPELTRVGEDIGLIERTINEENELAAAILAIDAAERANDTVGAFDRYHKLIRDFPRVRDDKGLKEAVARISARERQLVKVVEQPLEPLRADDVRPGEFHVILANRQGGGEARPKNQVAMVLAGGSVYALDGGNGQLLWRRFVGYTTHSHPVRVSAQPDADVVLVDTPRQELVRVKARTGELVWRLKLGERFSEPAVAGPRLYVATEAGRLLEIDAQTGESKRHVALPQKLFVPPAVASDQPYLFQLGDHSNLYVLNADTLQCQDVMYLGHKSRTIDVPPLILMGHVFVAENFRSDASRVHALKIRASGDGSKVFATQDPVSARGRVIVPLVAYNRRLLCLTDLGEIRVFDVDKSANENTLSDTGKLTPTLNEPQMGFALVEGSTLWIGDNKLTKYTVQFTRKEITRDLAVTFIGDTFVAPMQLVGNQLIHTRRVAGSTGIAVACIQVDNPRQVVWQTNLGVPAGRIAVNPATNEIVAISSAAALYQINSDVLKSGYADTPVANVGGAARHSFTMPIEFEKDVVAFFNPADTKQLLVYDPALSSSRLRIVQLAIGEATIPCTPIAFLGGLLAPADNGAVQLLKLSDGSNQILPFQPKLEPGDKIKWHRPALVGAEGQEFVIANDRKEIHRIGMKPTPMPHLEELAANRLDGELAGALAAAGDTVYGAVRTSSGDTVIAISLDELKVVKEWDLQGGVVTWGPERIGDVVMLVTDEKQLYCFGPGQSLRWPKPVEVRGQPAGRPLVEGEDYIFASISGMVWRIKGADGEISATAEVGEPLGAGPVAFRGRLLLCGNDGSLHVIPMPSSGANSGG